MPKHPKSGVNSVLIRASSGKSGFRCVFAKTGNIGQEFRLKSGLGPKFGRISNYIKQRKCSYRELEKTGGLTPSGIALLVGSPRNGPGIYTTLDRLCCWGFLRRKRKPKAATFIYRLTTKGRMQLQWDGNKG